MTPYVQDVDFTLYVGDALDVLRELPDESVHCCVTSPPYWGLRDYGTGQWEGGDVECDHRGAPAATSSSRLRLDGRAHIGPYEGEKATQHGTPYRDVCGKCGATRVDQQIGLEPTPDQYVETMVTVFREVRRVLRADGTLWLNLGDSYATTAPGTVVDAAKMTGKHVNRDAYRRAETPAGLKPKDLCGIPWAVAKAMQEPYYTGGIRSEVDRAWLAAVVDSEGCIYISRSKAGATTGRDRKYVRTQDAFDAGVKITNTSRALLERVVEIVGYGTIREQKNNGRQAYDWTAHSSKARTLLRELYPHLIAKQHEARLAIGHPPSGDAAHKAWQSLKNLHQGQTPGIDFAPPEPMWEAGWFLRSDVIWSKPQPDARVGDGQADESPRVPVSPHEEREVPLRPGSGTGAEHRTGRRGCGVLQTERCEG